MIGLGMRMGMRTRPDDGLSGGWTGLSRYSIRQSSISVPLYSTLPPSIYLSIHDLHSQQQQQQSSEQQSSGLAWPRGRYPVRECRTFAIRNGFHANLNITLSPTPNYHTIFKFYHSELGFSFTHTPLVDYIAGAAANTDGDNNNSNSYLYHAHLNSATKWCQ